MHVDGNNTTVEIDDRLVRGVGAQKGARSATAPDAICLGVR